MLNASEERKNVSSTSKKEGLQKIIAMIRRKRLAKKLTQHEFANLIDLSPRTYQRIEAGEAVPKLDVFINILSVLEISTTDSVVQCFQALEILSNIDKKLDHTFSEFRSRKLSLLPQPQLVKDTEINGLKKGLTLQNEANTHCGFFEWHLQKNSYFWSPETFELYEVESKELSLDMILDLVHPEDCSSIVESLNALIARGLPFHNTHRVKDSANGWKTLHVYVRRAVSEQNEVIVYGVAERLEKKAVKLA